MKVKFIGREKYSTGMSYISEPWKDTSNKDKFIYELYSEKNEDIKSTMEIVDTASDTNKFKHFDLINIVINAVNELTEKENIYNNLSEDEGDKMEEVNKNVSHPSHYNQGIEAIDIIESWDLNFSLGNAIKYILRSPYKGKQIEDLEKARWYIDREINRLKGDE